MKKFSRRDLLKVLSTTGVIGVSGVMGARLISEVTNSILKKFIGEAQSKYLKNTIEEGPARNLLQVNLGGAPSRWFFDHLLKPSDSDGFISHPWIGTVLSPQNSSNPFDLNMEYKTRKMNGFNFPILWQNLVAQKGGGFRPMADLQSHLLMIRGCNMRVDGHPINSARQVCPMEGDLSITGLVADYARTQIPAISIGRSPATRAFKSAKGLGVVDVPFDHPNYIDYLLSGFYRAGDEVGDKEIIMNAAISAQEVIDSYAASNRPGAEILFNEKKRAQELISRKLSSLTEVFGNLTKKYEDLLMRSMVNRSIGGITDVSWQLPSFPITVPGDKTVFESFGHFHVDQHLIDEDIRNIFKNVHRQALAKQFAVAEFCLMEGLSSSILLAPKDETWNFFDRQVSFKSIAIENIERLYDETQRQTSFRLKNSDRFGRGGNTHISMDTHSVGVLANFHACNQFYLGFSACLLELIDNLKSVPLGGGTLFDDTVIQIASEFEREPQLDPSGTAHSYRAGVTSVLSGIVNGPMTIGNIYVGEEKGEKYGTRGYAAPVDGLSNRVINFQNISSTMSSLLRVPKIVERAQSLVEVKRGEVINLVENGRNIEGYVEEA